MCQISEERRLNINSILVFVLCVNWQDVQSLTLALGPVSFAFFFNDLVIHNAPLTNAIRNVAFMCILLSDTVERVLTEFLYHFLWYTTTC